jgi:hypothetical protein
MGTAENSSMKAVFEQSIISNSVSAPPIDPFSASVLFLRSSGSRRRSDGRCWSYSFHGTDGTVLLEASFPEIPGEAIFYRPGDEASLLIRLKAWRWFWWNGRYDVVEPETGRVLATLRRTGGIESPDRRRIGRVRNPITGTQFFVRGVVIGLLDSILTQGESSGTIPADEFRVEAGHQEIGILRRTTLPFLQTKEPTNTAASSWWKRLFGRLRKKLARRFNSSGWKLDFTMDHSRMLDPRIRLAAALFRIHIERRYNA